MLFSDENSASVIRVAATAGLPWLRTLHLERHCEWHILRLLECIQFDVVAQLYERCAQLVVPFIALCSTQVLVPLSTGAGVIHTKSACRRSQLPHTQ